jgi:Autotransporter beta-domain
LGSGTNVFLSAGAYALNHYNNRYEDGYEAQLPTVTVGADYRVNDSLLAGLAFNYTNYDGTYDDGGGFDKHIFGPLLYAMFLPFQGAFANVVLGYARQENRNNRLASASSCGSPGPPCDPGEEPSISEGHTSADYSENQYTAGVLAGYDQPFGNVTVGPRFGLAFSYEDFESIKEEGDTGLELRYNNLNQTSVQSSLVCKRRLASKRPTASWCRRRPSRGSMSMPTATATSMLGWSRHLRLLRVSRSRENLPRVIGRASASASPPC